jgi:hypothetical protein
VINATGVVGIVGYLGLLVEVALRGEALRVAHAVALPRPRARVAALVAVPEVVVALGRAAAIGHRMRR